ncbi:hypothetical protein GCM10010483_63850 [Actinokineospora diospyrosa]
MPGALGPSPERAGGTPRLEFRDLVDLLWISTVWISTVWIAAVWIAAVRIVPLWMAVS